MILAQHLALDLPVGRDFIHEHNTWKHTFFSISDLFTPKKQQQHSEKIYISI